MVIKYEAYIYVLVPSFAHINITYKYKIKVTGEECNHIKKDEHQSFVEIWDLAGLSLPL